MSQSERVGEIIEIGTTDYLAQSYELHQAPGLGSFVRTSHGDLEVIGVVAGSRTSGVDPSRRPVARGQDEDDEDDLYRHHPELPELLRTEFSVRIVGFRQGGRFYQYLPPQAPRLHGFVYTCRDDEVSAFTERLAFVRGLLQPSAGLAAPPDELVAACIRVAETSRGGDRAFRVRAGKEVVSALLNDVARLDAILRRIQDTDAVAAARTEASLDRRAQRG